MPLTFSAVVACVLLFAAFERLNILFPPAGAILLLPMILDVTDLKLYPLQVAVGSLVFISAAFVLFKDKTKKDILIQ